MVAHPDVPALPGSTASRAAAPALPEGRARRGVLADTWTPVEGRPVYARVSWDAPLDGALPVVLVHGLVVSSLYMVPVMRHLAPYRRVLAPDLPGFGRSWKPRRVLGVSALADALGAWMGAAGIGRALLVGNSMGCQIAVDVAVRQPELVAGLVLIGPTMDPRDRTLRGEAWRLARALVHEPPALHAIELVDGVRFGVRRLYATARYALNDPIQSKLPLVRQPALVLRGEHDPIVPTAWAEQVAALLPYGRANTVPGAGHAINLDSPAELARVVRPFACAIERGLRTGAHDNAIADGSAHVLRR